MLASLAERGFSQSPTAPDSAAQTDIDLATDEIDVAMRDFMEWTGAAAATVAVGRSGEITFEKGYGYSDRRGKSQTRTDVTMRLASCTKPVTRALVESLVLEGVIDRETRIYEFLGIVPGNGGLADERVKLITIQHLIEHRGGWDRDATFDPMFRTDEIAKELKIARLEKHHIARYMWSRPLQSDPGAEDHYSNFGYLLLGLAIEKATGESYLHNVRERIGKPLGIDDLSISSAVRAARPSREVFYENENRLNLRLRDSSSGLVASAPSMCKFLGAWWMDGVPRNDYRNVYFYHFGSHPHTTTTILEQRLDGLDYVLMLNARREETYHEDNARIRERFSEVLDRIGSSLGD